VVERFLPALRAAGVEDDVIGTITTQDARASADDL
jgi:predicted metal-dependent phosphotriesterase family hydrolase